MMYSRVCVDKHLKKSINSELKMQLVYDKTTAYVNTDFPTLANRKPLMLDARQTKNKETI